MVQASLDRNIWICASDGDIDAVKEFLDEGGINVNQQDEHGYSCMHAAASYNHIELVHFLVQAGADVNIQDPDYDTPLHVCEEVGMAQVLIQHGADPQKRNREGKRPHDVAQEDGHLELANYLRSLCGLSPVSLVPDEGDEGENVPTFPPGVNSLGAMAAAGEDAMDEEDSNRYDPVE